MLQSIPTFKLETSQFDVQIWFDNDLQSPFPYTLSSLEDDDDPDLSVPKYADFAILSQASDTFQTVLLPMAFENVEYNWFAGGQNDANEEFVNALESRVERLYKDSWICQYFDFETKIENNIVYFYDKVKKVPVDSYRFQIVEFIPEKSIPYFLPSYDLANYRTENVPFFTMTSVLSNVPHGFKASFYPSTKSLFYKAPFFLIFKTPPSVKPNFLLFNSFFKSNSDTSILAMLVYNEFDNMFTVQFSPGITLPYLNSLSFTNCLEFNLFDSNQKQVEIADNSQLFVSVTTL